MVKKLIITIVLFTISCTLFASSGADINIAGAFSKTEDFTSVYYANVNPYYTFSDQALKGEVRGEITYANTEEVNVISLSLKRADFRFRLPSFNGKKMTIVVGRSPISWGLGSYYRVGDVLLDNMSKNQKAGSSDSRNIWLLSASQSLGSGFSIDTAFSLPLPESVTITQFGLEVDNSSKLAVGAKLKKSFELDTLKSCQLFTSYNEDKVTSFSAAFDIALYFDITTGFETKFRSSKDIRYVVNMIKLYNIESEENSYSLGLYLASELDFYSSLYETCLALSFTPSDRISLYLALTNQFSNSNYNYFTLSASTSILIIDNVKLEIGVLYSYQNSSNTNLFGATISLKSSI